MKWNGQRMIFEEGEEQWLKDNYYTLPLTQICKKLGVSTRNIRSIARRIGLKDHLEVVDLPNEEWRDIKGWEGLYMVSNLGRVKGLEKETKFGNRIKKYPERLRKSALGKRGYLVVALSDGDRVKHIPLHRVLAEAFIPNPENKPCIDHINTIRTDCRLENLRWVTHKENANNPITREKNTKSLQKSWDEGKFKNRRGGKYIRVQQIDKNGNVVATYDSIKLASESTGIDSSTISAICLGTNPKRHTAGGFYWEHVGTYYGSTKA